MKQGIRRKWVLRGAGMSGAAALLLGAIFVAATDPFREDDRLPLPARQTFTRGAYYAYGSPWGGEKSWLTKAWSGHADTMWIDLKTYPDNTRIDWRWPPFSPRHGVGVWGYDHVGYGFYDGGQPEKPVPARRVRDIGKLEAHYRWNGDFSWGAATVLMEFYLRTDPQNADAKALEIGWLLHVPSRTRKFIDQSRPVGTYVDPQGRSWAVAIDDKYCTFTLADRQDSASGTVDVKAALMWLQGKGLVRDDLWMTGLALGAEPVSGAGHVEIEHWQVDWK